MIFKCKMCGGDLDIEKGTTVCECEYCGTKQTVPKVDNEKKLTLFNRANRLRFNNEFDKASGVYESIVAEFPEEAEAYWGLVLCKFGIEYVDDPATGKKIPTCHRSSFDSVLDDKDFEMTMEYSDAASRKIYREEAKSFEELRKGIIEVSGKEEPYDIFICYKETDENGERTLDSVLAQDIYDAMTEKGYRVFFSRITLEDKLGQEYEPYIFAALHSAKVMLAVGTDYEYYNAVWVKNEWSRFLALMSAGEKKVLIPCYKNLDVYDMPKEFARLQAQDMGKVGAMQDLLRGVGKIIKKEQVQLAHENNYSAAFNEQDILNRNYGNGSIGKLVTRIRFFLEDENWESAREYCERILDSDPENAEIYLIRTLVELHLHTEAELPETDVDLRENTYFRRAYQFGTEEQKQQLDTYANEAEQNQIKGNIEKIKELERQIEELDVMRYTDLKTSDETTKKMLVFVNRRNELAQKVARIQGTPFVPLEVEDNRLVVLLRNVINNIDKYSSEDVLKMIKEEPEGIKCKGLAEELEKLNKFERWYGMSKDNRELSELLKKNI